MCGPKAYALFALGRYDEAAWQFAQGDKLLPGLPHNLMGLAASHWLAGAEQNAGDTIARLLQIAPEITVNKVSFPPFKDAAVTKLLRDSVIAAGLPE